MFPWLLWLTQFAPTPPPVLVHTITGGLSPKSVVHDGHGRFFVQNMVYLHTVNVYSRDFTKLATIPDQVEIDGVKLKGGPVECAISTDGRYAWVTNYQMFGHGYSNPGNDRAQAKRGKFDDSFLYRIDTSTFQINAEIQVGSVPKYVAATPDGKWVLVSNWSSSDLSVVGTQSLEEERAIHLGRFPRGIVVAPDSRTAYVAMVGARDVAKVNLSTWEVSWIKGVGLSPRHLCLSPDGRFLYASLNGEGKVAKVDLQTEKAVLRVPTGDNPRSMILSPEGQFLYVVNYNSQTLTKLRTADMWTVSTIKTAEHPIGVAYDPENRRIWVACYSGCIQVFEEPG